MSCEKAGEPHVTSFQLEVTNYLTGDSIPDQDLAVRGVYTSAYDFTLKTSAYGRFDTMIVHEHETDFDVTLNSSGQWFIASDSTKAFNGTNTEISMELIPLANFSYNFSCSGNGELRNVNRSIIYPFTPSQYVSDHYYGAPQMISAPYCNSFSNNAYVFSGVWLISYEKKSSPSASWITYSDTVTVSPGENFSYTIFY